MTVTENPVPRHRRPPVKLVVALTVMLGGLNVAPAAAEVIRASDISPYRFSYDDCGFTVDVDGVFSSPHSMARVGRRNDASAFLGHDRYDLTETQTRRGTDTEVVIDVHGLLHDIRATRIRGSVFEFTMMDVTHAELHAADGALLGREDGQSGGRSSSTRSATTRQVACSSNHSPSGSAADSVASTPAPPSPNRSRRYNSCCSRPPSRRAAPKAASVLDRLARSWKRA